MKPSERIRIIADAGAALSMAGWDYTDLVLDQFGASALSDFEGSLEQYVHKRLSHASQDLLVDLAEHLGIVADLTQKSRPEARMWREGDFRLFISHLAVEKDRATTLSRALDVFRICSFVAHEDIHPSLEWQREIETALQTMDAMVTLVTPGFSESAWTDQEVGFALGRGLLVVPVRLGKDPYGFFGKHQAIQGLGRTVEQVGNAVFDALATNPLTQDQIADSAIAMFEGSGSFRQAEASAERLLRFRRLTPTQLRRVEDACLDNLEIYDSFGCPSIIAQLYEKYGYRPSNLPVGWAEKMQPRE